MAGLLFEPRHQRQDFKREREISVFLELISYLLESLKEPSWTLKGFESNRHETVHFKTKLKAPP